MIRLIRYPNLFKQIFIPETKIKITIQIFNLYFSFFQNYNNVLISVFHEYRHNSKNLLNLIFSSFTGSHSSSITSSFCLSFLTFLGIITSFINKSSYSSLSLFSLVIAKPDSFVFSFYFFTHM